MCDTGMKQGIVAIPSLACLVIVVSTLFPFGFQPLCPLEFRSIVTQFDWTVIRHDYATDIPRNILLFLPFGFGVAALVVGRNPRRAPMVLGVIGVGLGLSISVESLQLFMPARASSLSDILANTLGTAFGFLFYVWWGTRALVVLTSTTDRVLASFTFPVLAALFTLFFALVIVFTVQSGRGTDLRNWELGFPLTIGNERTGDRPWHGQLSELVLASRALDSGIVAAVYSGDDPLSILGDSIVVSYPPANTRISASTAVLPDDFVWQGNGPELLDENGVELSSAQWLQADISDDQLLNEIVDSSQFTLIATVATADIGQNGPARIVSIAEDPYHRNFTLGQEGKNLIVRLRTPISGENGMSPEIIVPNVFVDDSTHRIVIAYTPPGLALYVDGVDRGTSVSYFPELAFFGFAFPSRIWRLPLTLVSMWCLKLLFYALIFMPLGLVLGLMLVTATGEDTTSSYLLVIAGSLFTSILFEGVVAVYRGWEPSSIVLGAALMAASAAWCKSLTRADRKQRVLEVKRWKPV